MIEYNSLFQFLDTNSRCLLRIDTMGTATLDKDLTLEEAREVIGQLAAAYFYKFGTPPPNPQPTKEA